MLKVSINHCTFINWFVGSQIGYKFISTAGSQWIIGSLIIYL